MLLLKFSRYSAAFIISVALLALAGWLWNINFLRSVIPGMTDMSIDAAMCFILTGLALLLLSRGEQVTMVRGLAALITLTGLLTALQYTVMYLQSGDAVIRFDLPGRMSAASAFNFLFIGLALLTLTLPGWRDQSQYLIIAVVFIAGIALLGYLYGISELYRLVLYTPMALHTAILFIVAGLALSFIYPDQPLRKLMGGSDLTSLSARRLLPTAILVPVTIGWLIITGQHAGFYDEALSFPLFAILNSTILGGVIYHNITELKAIEQDKRKAEAIILNEEKNRLDMEKQREVLHQREELVAMVSHDLRTPLAIILTSSEMMETYADRMSDEKKKEFLGRIRSQVSYMKHLIDDVVVLNRTRLAHQGLKLVNLDIRVFCQEIMDQLRELDREKHSFKLDVILEPACQVMIDPILLRRVLYNLIANAMKYAPGGGEICLKVWSDIYSLHFQISDQGIGIPAKDQARIFQSFQRAQNSDDFSGSGLGLAIVYETVHLHGGEITFESEEGKGTTFSFWLPLKPKLT